MTVTLVQSDNDSALGKLLPTGTSATTWGAISFVKDETHGGSAGSVQYLCRISGATNDVVFTGYTTTYGGIQQVTWAAGTWTVKLNVTVANANYTLSDIEIWRVNAWTGEVVAACGAVAGSLALGSTGIKTINVTTAETTGGIDDRAIVLWIGNQAASGTQTLGITPSQTDSAPLATARSWTLSPELALPIVAQDVTLAYTHHLTDIQAAWTVPDITYLYGQRNTLTAAATALAAQNVTAAPTYSSALGVARVKLRSGRTPVTLRGVLRGTPALQIDQPGVTALQVD